MGALKVWTGSQWTEAGGGLRDVPSGVIGAKVYKSASATNISTSEHKITWDTTEFDTDGFFDNANDRFTVPAGMGGTYVIGGNIQLDEVGAATSALVRIYVDGAQYTDWIFRDTTSSSDIGQTFNEPIELTPGQYVELYIAQNSSSTDILGTATGSKFWCYKLGSGNVGDAIGAHGYHSTTQSVTTSTITPMDIDTNEKDSDGFWSSGANDRYTIPAGLGGTYLLMAATRWEGSATGTEVFWRKNGVATYLSTSGQQLDGFTHVVVDLAAGDYVEACAYHTTGSNKTVGNAGTKTAQTHTSITLLATSGADPGRVRTGTAFPTPGTAWTDRFVRTDLNGIEFTHDGTRWVSTSLHSVDVAFDNLTASSLLRVAIPTDLDVYLVKWDYIYRLSVGSADWTVQVDTIDFENDRVTLDSINITSYTAGNDYAASRALGDVVTTTDGDTANSIRGLAVYAVENSGAAAFYGAVTIFYRLIAT